MIQYSVVMLGNPTDETQPKKAYARAQIADVMDLDAFAAHISDHNSVYDRGDVYAVLIKAVKCLKELVLDGKKVCLGDLGSFSISLASKGAANSGEFGSDNITMVTMCWDKGAVLKNMVKDAVFKQVSTRAAQAAALKAQKAGKTTASWDDNANAGEGTGTGSGTGTGDGTGTDTGTGGGTGTDTGGGDGTGTDTGGGDGSGDGNIG